MDVQIKWHGDQFNVAVGSKEGAEPFLEVKGCRIASGRNGEFVSWPATKNQNTGKYWNHVYASEKFGAFVLEKAQASRPSDGGLRRAPAQDDDSSIPF